MYDIARERRRNRSLIAANVCLVVVASVLLVFDRSSLINWMLLATLCFGLRSILIGRRSLGSAWRSRIATALANERWNCQRMAIE
jgi:hypothetical protein